MTHYCYLNNNYSSFTSEGQAQHETGIPYQDPPFSKRAFGRARSSFGSRNGV